MNVTCKILDHVAWVTINRPDRMNAVDSQTESDLERIWQSIEGDTSVRCVVLTGAGNKAFSAGADLKSESELSGLKYWAHQNPNGFGGIALRKSIKVPVVARVNGLALGGGMEMVLGCDIVIASERAKFSLPEAKVGRLPLDGGMVALNRMIPSKIASGMMMTGRMMSAKDLASYGLVNSVVSDEDLDNEVNEWVSDILNSAPLSLRAIKTSLSNTTHLSIQEARSLQTPELVAALVSEDAEEGVRAFREKRVPNWKGR